MRIALDARFWGLEHAGLGRYTMNLIQQLARQDQKNEYFLLLREKYFRSLRALGKNFFPLRAEAPPHSLREQILLPFILRRLKPDLVHYLYFIVPIASRQKFVVTIHDLIKHRHAGGEATTLPRYQFYLKYAAYRFDMWWAVRRSQRIIVPTNYVRRQIQSYYGLDEEKIVVTYEGAADDFKKVAGTEKEKKAILARYQLQPPYLLYVGNVYPYKNIPALLAALSLLPPPITLAIACARSVFTAKLKQLVEKNKLQKRVKLLGFVPDQDLAVLYNQALAFVSASLDEGFGITPLEAMAAGTAVVVSRAACFPETCGSAALYFDPHSPQEIAAQVKLLYHSPSLRQKLIAAGQKNLQRFSWVKMAQETLAVYNKVIAAK